MVKEAELSRQRGRMMGIHTHIEVEDAEECTGISMEEWDTPGLKDIPDVGDIQREDEGIDLLASLVKQSVSVVLRCLMRESVKCQFPFLSPSCLLLCCLLIESVGL